MITLKIDSVSAAREWAHCAAWTTLAATVATAAWGAYEFAYNSPSVPVWQILTNISILAAVTVLLFRFSRIASLVALILYLLNAMLLPAVHPMFRDSIYKALALFFGVVYVNGVRAMFAWHRFTTQAASDEAVSTVTAD